MPSIIPGYEYDIFISYRQKDNKYDSWVTRFVANLRKELEATFKEEVSVYFDENLYDGILETDNVDSSLSSKIKSLIFIPVLSQTYCDINSFAWKNEFIAFNTLTINDDFGREVKLPNGNVANRVLPVRIHDLDPADEKMIHDIVSSHIRSVEFIYRLPGVNRPLVPEDDGRENNPYYYRDQINRVANACKQIISGMRASYFKEDVNPLPLEKESSVTSSSEKHSQKPGNRQLSFRVKIIQQVEIFSLLSENLLEEVAAQIRTYNLQEDETVFQKGDKGESMYIIVDGRVKIHDDGHVFGFLAAGECFGEYTLVDEEERSASVTATEPTTLYKVDQKVFQELIKTNSTFTNSVLKVLIKRLRRLDNMQQELASSYKKIAENSKALVKSQQEVNQLNEERGRLASDALQIARSVENEEDTEQIKKKMSSLIEILGTIEDLSTSINLSK